MKIIAAFLLYFQSNFSHFFYYRVFPHNFTLLKKGNFGKSRTAAEPRRGGKAGRKSIAFPQIEWHSREFICLVLRLAGVVVLAAGLRLQPDVGDLYVTLDGLAHVVDRQSGDRDGG